MTNINIKASKFNTIISGINKKRDFWQSDTKPLLVKVLNRVKDEIGLDLIVQTIDARINHESVHIQFKSKPSGISEKNGKGLKAYIKWGGGLTFNQMYNGEVHILVTYPFIDELVPPSKRMLLVRIGPDKISEEYIHARVNNFLDEMLNWEIITSGNSIDDLVPVS